MKEDGKTVPNDHRNETEDMDVLDETQCKFNINSFKMVFVVNSESYLYKRMALKRAKQVSVYTLGGGGGGDSCDLVFHT